MEEQSDIKSPSSEGMVNRDEHEASMNMSVENKYIEVNENLRDDDSRDVYYTYVQDENNMNEVPHLSYMNVGIPEPGTPVDPVAMQTAAAINHSMMFQNQAPSANYSQFPMFNGMNSMYGGVSPYYGGGNMPMAVNPYYDPYGIINPLASAALNVEKTKKKTKKFICC